MMRPMTRASLEKDPQDVAAMFDDVAGRYDLTNDVLSLGQDRLWRRAVVKAVAARSGETVLDIAAGTGTSSEPFADAGVRVVPADFSLGMLRVGRRRRSDLGFTAADAMRLPFADEGVGAGPASLVGLEVAHENGWEAPRAAEPSTAEPSTADTSTADTSTTDGPVRSDGDAPGRTEVTPKSPEADAGTQAAPKATDPADQASAPSAKDEDEVTDADSAANERRDEVYQVGVTGDDGEEDTK